MNTVIDPDAFATARNVASARVQYVFGELERLHTAASATNAPESAELGYLRALVGSVAALTDRADYRGGISALRKAVGIAARSLSQAYRLAQTGRCDDGRAVEQIEAQVALSVQLFDEEVSRALGN